MIRCTIGWSSRKDGESTIYREELDRYSEIESTSGLDFFGGNILWLKHFFGVNKYGANKYGENKFSGNKYGENKFVGNKFGGHKIGGHKFFLCPRTKFGVNKFGRHKIGRQKVVGHKFGRNKIGGNKFPKVSMPIFTTLKYLLELVYSVEPKYFHFLAKENFNRKQFFLKIVS